LRKIDTVGLDSLSYDLWAEQARRTMSTQEPPQTPGQKRRLLNPSAFVAFCTAAVALVAGLVSLGASVVPSLLPDPDTNRSVSASIAAVDRNVTRTAARAESCPTAEADGDVGAVVYVKYDAKGFKNGHLRVRCSIFDTDLQKRLAPSPAALLSSRTACTSEQAKNAKDTKTVACGFADVKTRTTDDRAVEPLWVSIPASRANLRIRVAIYDDNDVMLGYADSPTFRSGVLSSPEVRTASAGEELAITHVVLQTLSRTSRQRSYVAAVAILRKGSALNRGRWASVEVRPYPQYAKAGHRIMLLHHRTHGAWHVIAAAKTACRVPQDIVAAVGLVAGRCSAKQ
jgi:hypothetical protein